MLLITNTHTHKNMLLKESVNETVLVLFFSFIKQHNTLCNKEWNENNFLFVERWFCFDVYILIFDADIFHFHFICIRKRNVWNETNM